MIKNTTLLITIFALNFTLKAQELPQIKALRAEENYSSLLKNDTLRNASFLNKLKAIPLNKDKSIFLSLGGEFRPRWEYTENKNWSANDNADESFYSQRIMLHSDLHLGKYVRFFGQLTHGLVSLKEPVYVQSDKLDLHQAFAEFNIPIKNTTLKLRAGRQELLFGSGRLMAFRDGPNSRRSFDMARIMLDGKGLNSNLFFGREVTVPEGVFDNNSTDAPYTWGMGLTGDT
ncbi:MAG TPA: alginate export family protein, partial [Flavobacterium sp.]|nr:alginate export family protein [Flavobacterium sp.]